MPSTEATSAALAPATQIETPDQALNHIIWSSQVRCLIAARNEADGARVAPWIAAMSYGPLESEAHSVIRGMDFLGHADFARRGLEYFIHRYNTNGFLTTGYTTFGTAWHLWTVGEHYQLTQDREWLGRMAPELRRVGEWILRHPGYVWKDTSYHNTLLIDSIGQYGENSEWFEDLPYRQRRKYPFMERAKHCGKWDYCVANITNAYPEKTGVKLLRRYVVYVRPDLWLIIDAIKSSKPIIPTQLFHAGFPLKEEDKNVFSGHGETASCRIKIHLPFKVKTNIEEQILLHTSRTYGEKANLLRVLTSQKSKEHLLVTEIQAFDVGKEKPVSVKVRKWERGGIEIITPTKRFRFTPFGGDPIIL